MQEQGVPYMGDAVLLQVTDHKVGHSQTEPSQV